MGAKARARPANNLETKKKRQGRNDRTGRGKYRIMAGQGNRLTVYWRGLGRSTVQKHHL